ncbi:hypothetical protein gvb04_05255 [Gardnerella vaginalis]|nr:hypothetical protein gvb04_05255 [Gardnerella vaginalis]
MRKMRFRLIIIMRIFAVIRWHCTNEKFSAQEYIDVNCNYPGDWDGAIECIEEMGEILITAVRVFPKNRSASFHVVSFVKFKDNLISELDECWADDGEAPDWRKKLNVGVHIR